MSVVWKRLLYSDNIIPASQIEVLEVGTATYDDVQDWLNNTQASGAISGGGFTDNTDGSMTVAAGTGFVKTTNSGIGVTKSFDWAENDSVALTDNVTNYIGIDYNAGSPQVFVETSKTADGRTKFYLGKVFREGTDLHFLEAGQNVTELMKRVQARFTSTEGEFTHASGMMLSETGERYLAITSGVGFSGLTRITTASVDTSGADTFELNYYNGSAWVVSDVSQIPNTQYNDITSGLVDLTSNRYGVYWVYLANDGEPVVVYGQGDYTLANAENATPPSTVPDHVAEFSTLIGKIIVQKSEPNFYMVETAFNPGFSGAGIADHGDLTGLTDDDHSQYPLVAGTRPIKYETTLEKTADYTLTSADFGKVVCFNSAVAAGTMTFPSVGSAEDGAVVTFVKTGSERLTVESVDTDGIADSSTPGTIYSDSAKATLTLVYIHAITSWVIKSASGTWITT
jgi:hypothetical protein